ncbi:low molecular weight protein-tyrosine-phosphatase [Actinomadura sp. B10D3]|uniref:low molecular weight protein-tyrosine-phosphatase n=1 Tax=Actinomadura sp. B10D3 TaxID=3153557 RepID=UPI00325F4F3F
MALTPAVHVCFICKGNICRSPMATILYRHHLRKADLDRHVHVTSAGLFDWYVGSPADPRTMAVLRSKGIPGEHVAACVDSDHLSADLIVAMDEANLRQVREIAPPGADIRLMRSFAAVSPREPAPDVPDPYYGDDDDFRTVFDVLEDSMPGLVRWTRERLAYGGIAEETTG